MSHENNLEGVQNIRLVIFDIDGTLTQYHTMDKIVKDTLARFSCVSKKEYSDQMFAAFEETGTLTETNEFLTMQILYTALEKHATFIKELDLDLQDFTRIMLEYEKEYVITKAEMALLIFKLKMKGIKVVCFSNWFLEQATYKLKHKGLLHFFEHIYTCEDMYAKPNPTSFERILKKEGVLASQTLMIGDSMCDMLSNKCGIQSVLIDYKNTKPQELILAANAVITRPLDLIELLSQR